MATPTAWLLNLDADIELADPGRYRRTPERELRIRDLYASMSALTAPEDLVLDAASRERARAMRVLSFCPTPSALARLLELGLPAPAAPSLAVLQEANSRAFCARLGQTLPAAGYAYDMETLEKIIQTPSPTGDFLLKRAFGFAGGGRRLAQRGSLDPSTRGFARRSFECGQGLQVEPWLARGRDFALHGYLGPCRTLSRGPLMQQHCDPMGRWQRSERISASTLDPAHLRSLEEELERSARALSAIGYFGPFGIDAFEYQDARGKPAFQPRSEINARFSMGYPRSLLETALAELASGDEL